jgi:hypothetical protein
VAEFTIRTILKLSQQPLNRLILGLLSGKLTFGIVLRPCKRRLFGWTTMPLEQFAI